MAQGVCGIGIGLFPCSVVPGAIQLHVDAASSDQLSDLQQKQKDLQQQKQELALNSRRQPTRSWPV